MCVLGNFSTTEITKARKERSDLFRDEDRAIRKSMSGRRKEKHLLDGTYDKDG